MIINKAECNIRVKTYGDVIRHMTNDELALFLEEMIANIELGILAVMRAKMLDHRKPGEEPKLSDREFYSFYSFMEHRISEEPENYADIWGINNWIDLMQWESTDKKNFGCNVVY